MTNPSGGASRFSGRKLAALHNLSAEGPIQVRVRGGCMDPVLADGELASVERRRIYWPGDVIVFQATDGLRAHRLLGYRPTREGLAAVTRPDASIDAWDAPVQRREILGRVTAVESGAALHVSFGQRLRSIGRFVSLASRKLFKREVPAT